MLLGGCLGRDLSPGRRWANVLKVDMSELEALVNARQLAPSGTRIEWRARRLQGRPREKRVQENGRDEAANYTIRGTPRETVERRREIWDSVHDVCAEEQTCISFTANRQLESLDASSILYVPDRKISLQDRAKHTLSCPDICNCTPQCRPYLIA